jgi:hypothetical protein
MTTQTTDLAITGVHGTPRYLRVSSLTTDPRYERPLNMAAVRRIAAEFDPDAVGMLYVSHRADGTDVILDGQHRAKALVLMQWEDQMVPCFVYENMTVEDEARVFRIINEGRRRLTALDLFRARVTEREPEALDLHNIFQMEGLRPGTGSSPNIVQCMSAVQKIYKESGREILRDVLNIAANTWGRADNSSLQSPIVLALALILAEYGQTLDRAAFITRISTITPNAWVGRARAIKSSMGGNTETCMAVAMIGYYNERKRTGRIPDWHTRPFRRNRLVPNPDTWNVVQP